MLTMGTNQQFNLRWNNHTNNILQVFLEQFSSEALVDVTLSCQGQFLRAHKMVLSACSPYFQELFQVHQVQHPVIIMNGMKFPDIKQIIEFMYKGEVKVLEAELDGLLAAAESLQVKGLSHVRNKYQKGDIQGANSHETASSEPPPLEPCLPAPPTLAPSSAPSQTSAQIKPQVQFQAKGQPALPPLAPTSAPATASPAATLPSTQSVKRKKSPEKVDGLAKKRNCQAAAAAQAASAKSVPEKPNSDDDEFPAMIKVEPLDIRDIDEEQPWEPPKLVIDMREGGSKIKTFNSARQSLLKIRSASELGAPDLPATGDDQSPRGDDPLKENEPKKEPLDNSDGRSPGKEWRGGKRVTRIPRPPNAFMIFANEWRRKLAVENPSDSNKDISVRLGVKWKNLSAEKKALYYSASRIADEEHKRKYPNYYYSPKEARLRKSQQQNLRRRFAVERLNNAGSTAVSTADVGKPMSPDPLRFVKVFMKDPSTRGVFVAVDAAKSAAGASASADSAEGAQENLQEEFLKMVEGGDVEAQVEEDLEGLSESVEEEEAGDVDTKPVLTEDMLLLQEKAGQGGAGKAKGEEDKSQG